MSRLGPIAQAQKDVKLQRDWIKEHGGTLHGYIVRYGTAAEPIGGTMGGPAVYEADLACLRHLEDVLEQRTRRARQPRFNIDQDEGNRVRPRVVPPNAVPCPDCEGTGERHYGPGLGGRLRTYPCPRCDGSGQIGNINGGFRPQAPRGSGPAHPTETDP